MLFILKSTHDRIVKNYKESIANITKDAERIIGNVQREAHEQGYKAGLMKKGWDIEIKNTKPFMLPGYPTTEGTPVVESPTKKILIRKKRAKMSEAERKARQSETNRKTYNKLRLKNTRAGRLPHEYFRIVDGIKISNLTDKPLHPKKPNGKSK